MFPLFLSIKENPALPQLTSNRYSPYHSMVNRPWDAKQFLLTYPRNDATHAAVSAAIFNGQSKYGPVELAVCGYERHEDGGKHFHVFLRLKNKLRSRAKDIFAGIGCGKTGNYVVAKSPLKAIKYCMKGGDWAPIKATRAEIEAMVALKVKQGKRARIHQMMLKTGGRVKDVLMDSELGPTALFSVAALTKAAPMMATKQVPEVEFDDPLLTIDDPSDVETLIATWFKVNVMSKAKRSIRQKQLLITGVPGCGKSSLVQRLSSMLAIYTIPDGEDFCDFYDDDRYDLAVLDEYNSGTKQLGWLNKWLDGSNFCLRTKGGQYEKKFNIPTVILSNTKPEHWYAQRFEQVPQLQQALEDRLLIVDVGDGDTLHRLWDAAWVHRAAPTQEEASEEPELGHDVEDEEDMQEVMVPEEFHPTQFIDGSAEAPISISSDDEDSEVDTEYEDSFIDDDELTPDEEGFHRATRWSGQADLGSDDEEMSEDLL